MVAGAMSPDPGDEDLARRFGARAVSWTDFLTPPGLLAS
jgi:hypothetical protein